MDVVTCRNAQNEISFASNVGTLEESALRESQVQVSNRRSDEEEKGKAVGALSANPKVRIVQEVLGDLLHSAASLGELNSVR